MKVARDGSVQQTQPSQATGIDTSNFKCYRFPEDGSVYYGEVMWLREGKLVTAEEKAALTEEDLEK